jgi:hypothetical protein
MILVHSITLIECVAVEGNLLPGTTAAEGYLQPARSTSRLRPDGPVDPWVYNSAS